MRAQYVLLSLLFAYSDFHSMKSIKVQPTILGHIAVSIALGGQGQLSAVKHEFNQVFLCDEPKNNCLLLLIKVSYVSVLSTLTDESIVVHHHIPLRWPQ